MAELFGKTTGCCRGYGGSMHTGDPAVGALTAIAIVGGNIPVATGMALAFKMQQTGQVVACFMGDGATNEGAFHEGVNMAAIWDLPVVFVCENNMYGASTPVEQVVKLDAPRRPRLRLRHPRRHGGRHGCAGGPRGGRRQPWSAPAGAKARPSSSAMTYRFIGHSRSDTRGYRSREEEEQWKQRDPIPRLGAQLVASGEATEADLQRISR